MGKVIITSDWHIEDGIYKDICLDFVTYLQDFANTNEIRDIIIAGDIFEKSSKIKNSAFIPLFFKFKELKEEGFNLYFLLGNHDIFNMENDSLVETFAPFGKVIKTPEEIEIFNRKFYFVPYTKDETEIPDFGDVLITHLGIVGFELDNRYHVNEKIGLPVSKFKDWKWVFSGHFHRPQKKENIIYMGSPYQMNFGEAGQKKGFCIFDTEADEYSRVWYDAAPTYIKIKARDFLKNPVDVSNSFLKVCIDEKLDNYLQLKHILFEKGAIEVHPDFEESKEDIQVGIEERIDLNLDVLDMVKDYIINKIKIDKIDNDKLLDIFEKAIDE